MESLFGLTFEIQIVLVGGYLGFWVSTVGRNKRMRPTDIAMQILVFGLISKLVLLIFSSFGVENEFYPPIIAVLAAIIGAAVWRKIIGKIVVKFMKWTNVHHDDHSPSVIASMLGETGVVWQYVQIHLNDGKVYESIFGLLPKDLPLNAITIDEEGNVSLYVTKIIQKDRVAEPTIFEFDANSESATITYIPVHRIERIDVNWG
ncbi:MAG: hypothetical protein COC24_013710 [Alphaproteobacteria bacterium]|nr:hypothetical protein [Alphaproteobacteria bacterium]